MKPTEPVHQQVFIGRGKKSMSEDDFPSAGSHSAASRSSAAIYKRHERRLAGYYPVSLSCRTVVYKGMFLADQLGKYHPDLHDPEFESASRSCTSFSTNTFPTWSLAHPCRMIAHNGEINTLRGNNNWMAARQASVSSELFGDDIEKPCRSPMKVSPTPPASTTRSNSWCRAATRLAHAMMMMIPEALGGQPAHGRGAALFYEYHAALMEQPWDGPAAIAFTNGRQIGATLDRNGLRPARYLVTRDDRIVMASEMGVLPIPEKDIVTKWRLQPGKMLLVDLDEGASFRTRSSSRRSPRATPTGNGSRTPRSCWRTCRPRRARPRCQNLSLLNRQQAFGYTQEDLAHPDDADGGPGRRSHRFDGQRRADLGAVDRPKLLFTYFRSRISRR